MEFIDLPSIDQPRSAAERIADVLRGAIIEGQLQDGAALNQVELAAHFGVSRVPVREALRRLAGEGLVRADAHRLAVVRRIDRRRITQILEVRALLELYMLERALPHITDEDVSTLRELCRRMEGCSDLGQWLEYNVEFHRALLARSDAEVAMEFADQLAAQVVRYLHQSADAEHLQQANGEHRAIVDAVANNDAAHAAEILQAHIERTIGRVMNSVRPAAGGMAASPRPQGAAS